MDQRTVSRWPIARLFGAAQAFALPFSVALLLVAALWALLLYDSRRGIDAAVEQARKDATNLAVAFREHISGTVGAIDQLMIAVAAEHSEHPDLYLLPAWLDKPPVLGGLSLQVSIVGPDGVVRASNFGADGVSVVDRPHFQHHLDPAAAQPYISAPALGRASGRWSVFFTRRLTRPDGSFDGMVAVSVDPASLSGLFDHLDLGAKGVATLVGTDGVVRARRSRSDRGVAQNVIGTPLFETARRGGSGTYIAKSNIDGADRIYGYATLANYPLIVALGLSQDEAIAPALHQRKTYLLLGSGGTIAIFVLTFMLARQSQRRRRQELADHAQLRIAAQNEQFDRALGNIAQGLCLFDAEGRIVLCNASYLELYELSPEIVKPGCTLEALLRHRQTAGQFAGDVEALRQDILARAGKGLRTARTVELPDGRSIHVVQSPLPGGGWVATHEDVTERNRMERALAVLARAAEEAAHDARGAHKRLQEAIDVVPEGFALFDAQDRYVLWNEQYLKLYPESAAHIHAGARFADVLRAGLERGQYAAAQGREEEWLAERLAMHHEMESSHEQHLPGDRWVRVQERRTADGGSVGIRVDITDLKRREDSFKLLFDTNPIPMFVVSLESLTFLAGNDAALEFYGYSREQFIGMSILQTRPEADRELFARTIRTHGTLRRAAVTRHQLADGTVRDVEVYARAFTYSGEAARLAAVIDTTERKAIERQLQHAQKMEAVGGLTGGLAHDFNNLLTIIISNLDLLGDEITAESARAKLTTILEASERGAELTRQMLAFSRRQPLQPKRFDCNALVATTAQLLRRTLGESIRIDLRSKPDAWHALADEAQLESALVNIALNARDAMPNGGTLIIETHNAHLDADYAAQQPDTKPGDYVVIEITDTGSGMSAEVRERVFEPFYTTKAPGKGTGLGLSMVYGFVKQSGGHITLYSELGKGSTFKLYLPRAISAEEGARLVREAKEPQAASAGDKVCDKVILAVDDSASVRAAVVARLTGLGYRVIEADGPAAALAQLEGGAPIDLLFTDIVMPGGMSGKQLATIARAKCPKLKVLFTSGFPGSMLSGGSELEDGDRLLSKPYRKNDLARAVSEALAE